ncbi:MAG TPA: discoidin domain-containing protein [Longimicrobiales bacterium]|nr:discoidin domain-containing protein [Longimicrobiales bacterium]
MLLSLSLSLSLASCATRPEHPGTAPTGTAATILDGFDQPALWTAAPASGVALALSGDSGRVGRALRVDFDFQGGGGWAALRRELPLTLPENYELSFWLKGDAPENTLEFKLIDPSNDNVWWVRRPEFEFRGDWRRITFRKRHVTFAWGPARGGEIRDVAALELAITAGTGGRGTIWLDELTLTPLEPVLPYDLIPIAMSSAPISTSGAAPPAQPLVLRPGAVIDGDTATFWRTHTTGSPWLQLDFQRTREYGGLVVDWLPGERAPDYDVQISADGRAWETIRAVRSGGRPRDYLALPETESRYLRLVLLRPEGTSYGIRELRVQPLEWAESRNTLFETIAADSRPGLYPKYFGRVQSYWTLVGANGDDREGMLNEEGMLEVDKRAFSIEPFLFHDGRLVTWSDARVSQSLADGYLPIPSVQWVADGLRLEVTAFTSPDSGTATLYARYRVTNPGSAPVRSTLFLALRPFQVNPSWQFLNNPGGAARVHEITHTSDGIAVDDTHRIVPVTAPAGFGAASFDEGDITQWLERGVVPDSRHVRDESGHASAALAYPLELAAGASRDVWLAVPWHQDSPVRDPAAELARTTAAWREELNRLAVNIPAGERLVETIRANLAYILINRDAAAIQPGSRSYERSWIRDGSLTSAALLRLGHPEEVRAFIEWYAPYQYEDGKVPCCVDHSGAGPVPENDSHGQLIFLVAEYFRHTGDRALVERVWPNLVKAVAYMDSLRASRRTEEYRTKENGVYFGLMPESISHEGYSEKPMHSYWDDSFALKGYEDAAWLADTLGRTEEARRFAASFAEFRDDLVRSLEIVRRNHGIDYLPGAAELGDFDATSTTVAVSPAGAERFFDRIALERTFERYWENFRARMDSVGWHAYTPYELRTVGTLIRLGHRDRAHAVLDWFMTHQRPAAWRHWAEVVFEKPEFPGFIGDMPHTWVGSDFIRSVLDMFAYERASDDALVVGAGILPAWVQAETGVAIEGMSTAYGELGYTMQARDRDVVVRFTQVPRLPPGGIVLVSPRDAPLRAARADGRALEVSGREVRITRAPREVVLQY